MKKEIEILGKLDHPNIIKLYDAIDTSHKVSLIMEYSSGKSLHSYLRKKEQFRIKEEEAKVIFR